MSQSLLTDLCFIQFIIVEKLLCLRRGDHSSFIDEYKFAHAEGLDRKSEHGAKGHSQLYTVDSLTSPNSSNLCSCVFIRTGEKQKCLPKAVSPAGLWLVSTLDWQNVWHTCWYLHCTTRLLPRSVWRVSFFVNIYILPLLVLFRLSAPLRSSPDVNHIWVVIYT